MTITVVGSQKGGVGKSILATTLATAHALQNDNVLLVDADRQLTAYNWAVRRQENKIEPAIPFAVAHGADFGEYLTNFKADFDHMIIDCAGYDSEELRTALLYADLLISPLQPAQADMETLTLFSKTIEGAQTVRKEYNAPPLVASFVINRASTHPANTETKEVLEILTKFPNLKFTGGVVHDRIEYRHAFNEGKSVLERKPANQKAIDEINFLFKQVQNEQKNANDATKNRAAS